MGVGRFRYLEKPVVHPKKCVGCSNTTRPVVDFGLDIEMDNGWGAVYLCTLCMVEAAKLTGLIVPVEDYEALKGELEYANAALEPYRKAVGTFDAGIRALYDSFANELDSIVSPGEASNEQLELSGFNPVQDAATVAEDGGAEQSGDEGSNGSGSGEEPPATGQKPKSSRKSGLASVPADSPDEPSESAFNLG